MHFLIFLSLFAVIVYHLTWCFMFNFSPPAMSCCKLSVKLTIVFSFSPWAINYPFSKSFNPSLKRVYVGVCACLWSVCVCVCARARACVRVNRVIIKYKRQRVIIKFKRQPPSLNANIPTYTLLLISAWVRNHSSDCHPGVFVLIHPSIPPSLPRRAV
jgi:hypothetical protein